MQNSLHAAGAAALLVAVVAANPAHADQTICGLFDSVDLGKKNDKNNPTPYTVQNNLWNDKVPNNSQCIKVVENPPGFEITTETGDAPKNGAPLGYPNIYIGCRYTHCSPTTPPSTQPIWQLKSIKSARSTINYDFGKDPNAAFDASYDIWLDHTARTDGVNDVEVMIWLTNTDGINPIGGDRTPERIEINHIQWDVYAGNNNMNDVITYVARPGIDNLTFDVLDFINDAKKREASNPKPINGGPFTITDEWYLTSIQAGFEPWQGGVGNAVKKFDATVELEKKPNKGSR
jgi:Glycosyl hydrolase family 12